MQKLFLTGLFAVGLVVAGCGKRPSPDAGEPGAEPTLPLVQWHFLGTDLLASGTNATKFREVWAMPESQELQTFVIEKLARMPHAFFAPDELKSTNTFAAELQPLFAELLRVESFGELRLDDGLRREYILAAKLDKERASAWQASLEKAFSAWLGAPVAETKTRVAGRKCRQIHAAGSSLFFRLVRNGPWLVLDCGHEYDSALDTMVARLEKLPGTVAAGDPPWLEVFVDWPRLRPALSLLEYFPLPPTQISLNGRGENLRAVAELRFPHKLDWVPEGWIVPTNTIREPLISFSAMRGLRAWLNALPPLRELSLSNPPSQAYFWAVNDMPLQSFVALPLPDATNEMAQFAPRLIEKYGTNVNEHIAGVWRWKTNASFFYWEGLPFAVPFLQPMHEESGDVLLGGLFPNSPKRAPFPMELLAQLSPTNLIYYDWEITADRLAQWRQIVQLALIVTVRQQFTTNQPAQKWLLAVGPKLANTVTAATLERPDTVSIVRSGPVGLTAVELVAMAAWISSADFPLGGIQFAPELRSRRSLKSANTNQPNAQAGSQH